MMMMRKKDAWQVYYRVKRRLWLEAFVSQIILGTVGVICLGLAVWLGPFDLVKDKDDEQQSLQATPVIIKEISSSSIGQTEGIDVVAAVPSSGFPFIDRLRLGNTAEIQINEGLSISAPRYPEVQSWQGGGRRPSQLSFITADGIQSFTELPIAQRISAPEVKGIASQWDVPLWYQPAWLPGVTCGETGVVLVAGHVSWYGREGPFGLLGTVENGTQVHCTVGDESFYYVVETAFEVSYGDTTVYRQPLEGATSTLVLFSCTPEVDGIVVVKARLV